jgi:hypothetical protein
MQARSRLLPGHLEQHEVLVAAGHARDCLVAYIFSDGDKQYMSNMRHFIRHAVRPDDRCDYVFVLQVSACVRSSRPPLRRWVY